ncbi:prolyl oligopeptidase family serine peptidase [Nakamurella sp. UYEF19]|uniref:S9 family peptidase n=1 Tax=Nakamurella sp. UYEF19 TaxID=1756392 RepID=UPI003396BB13
MSGLKLSPDGSQLVVGVSTPDPKSHRYQSALWRVDPRGEQPAVRLTRGATGESSAVFTHTGDLLFTSKRTDPDDVEATDRAPLWLLPSGLGEARVVASRIGGFSGVMAAAKSPVVVVPAPVLPGATDLSNDDELRKARKDAGISAILHDGYPVRFWDHDLGPDRPHLLAGDLSGASGSTAVGRLELRDLTPAPDGALREQGADLSQDGTLVVTGWHRPVGSGDQRSVICLIDVASGDRRVLRDDPDADLFSPLLSPDGTRVAYIRERLSTPELAPQVTVEVVDVQGGTVSRPSADWDRWPSDMAWTADGTGLLVAADQDGRSPVFVLDLAGGVRQLTDDDASYTELAPSPDGASLYALRTSYATPAHPVRISLIGAAAGTVVELPAPARHPELPGTLVDIRASASDGVAVRGWLALPHGADADHPAPLLLWIHGGPLGSWNSWSWRWTPWMMVAAGYAVLLPDPALSTGYGQDFIQRGWGAWGGAPFTDLMAVTDEVEARDDIDASRTAAMGGSFGGYMANWVAGHTDRFKAVVTHASLWSLDEFGPTTDGANYWGREMSPSMTAGNSPHLFISSINTPMLVIHGDKDYRVPIGQGIRLWYDLLSKSGLPADADGRSPHRFLYFPSENHWVLTPGHAKVWYEVVLGFLAEHVLDAAAAPVPSLLGGPPAPDAGVSGG